MISAKNSGVARAARGTASRAAQKPHRGPTAESTRPPKGPRPDAVDLLVDDHLAAGKVFEQYEKLAQQQASPARRKLLADKVCRMLTLHTTLEEDIFYPAARAAGIDAREMDEAWVEHASAKALIAQLRAGQPGDDCFDAKVKVLGDLIEHHVIEEHTAMFPECRRSPMDLVGLRKAMTARKKALQAAG